MTRNDDNCLDDLRISKNNKILKNKINSISISTPTPKPQILNFVKY